MQMKWGEEEALQLQEEGKTEITHAPPSRVTHNNPQREEKETEFLN
jgi:hypothetical protein